MVFVEEEPGAALILGHLLKCVGHGAIFGDDLPQFRQELLQIAALEGRTPVIDGSLKGWLAAAQSNSADLRCSAVSRSMIVSRPLMPRKRAS